MILTKPKFSKMPGLVVGQGRRSTLKTLVCSTRSNAPRERKVAGVYLRWEIDSFVPVQQQNSSMGVTVVRWLIQSYSQ